MELDETKVRGRRQSILDIYHTGEFTIWEKTELDEELIFLERLLRYCGEDLLTKE